MECKVPVDLRRAWHTKPMIRIRRDGQIVNRVCTFWLSNFIRCSYLPEADQDTYYTRQIAPRLHGYSVRAIRAATGLSLRYCAFIRNGKRIPHARHWPALRTLVDHEPRHQT